MNGTGRTTAAVTCRSCERQVVGAGVDAIAYAGELADAPFDVPLEIVLHGSNEIRVTVRCVECHAHTDATDRAARFVRRAIPSHPCPCGCGGLSTGGSREIPVAYRTTNPGHQQHRGDAT